MNILYLSHRIPYPPNKGDKLRAFRQLEHLAKRHRVWCACFVDDPADMVHAEELSEYCEQLIAIPLDKGRAKRQGLTSLLTGSTLTEGYYFSRGMMGALAIPPGIVSFDAVVAFSSSMAPYALGIPADRRVLDLCDLDSQKWHAYARRSWSPMRLLYALEGRRLGKRERRWLEDFDATTLITKAEAIGLDNHSKHRNLHIVGNGVHLPECDLLERVAGPERDEHKGLTVGFVGQMDYAPNIDAAQYFVHKCWPRVRRAASRTKLMIVGRNPTRAVQRLAKTRGVYVTGAVKSVQRSILDFDVSIAPMRIARGLQNKVLEAMAAARPTVLSSHAAQGIEGRDGHEFLIADTASHFSECVIRLLRDRYLRARIGRAGRDFVSQHHRWETEMDKFEKIVTGMLDSKDAPAEMVHRQSAGQAAKSEDALLTA